MGRMRQMSIERVDAVDEPATGARWIIAKRSKQADAKNETPETAELVKAAFEALRKDAELTLTDEAAEALNALAAAHEVDGLKLEKDEDETPAGEGDEPEAENGDEADEDEADETDEGDEDEADDEPSVEKRLDVIERALEVIVEKLDGEKPTETKKSAPARRRRTSKQAQGQDDLGGEGEQLRKSDGRVSYASILDQ